MNSNACHALAVVSTPLASAIPSTSRPGTPVSMSGTPNQLKNITMSNTTPEIPAISSPVLSLFASIVSPC